MKYDDSMFNIYITIDNEECIILAKQYDELSSISEELQDKLDFFRNKIKNKKVTCYFYVENYILDWIIDIQRKEIELLKRIFPEIR